MEDYADFLAAEAESDVAAVHQFILCNHDAALVHVFFEGEDDFKYYLPELRKRSRGKELSAYYCGGKWNVVAARDFIEASYAAECLYFIDRDYDDLLGRQATVCDRMYITDGYSVENDLSSALAVDVLLHDLMLVPRVKCGAIAANIDAIQAPVLSRFLATSAWIIAAKEQGCNPNLNNTNSLNGVVLRRGDGRLCMDRAHFLIFKRRVASGNGEPSLTSIIKWRRRLEGLACSEFLRGKYAAWIFCKASLLAIEDENSRRTLTGEATLKVPDSLKQMRIFDLLAGRVPYPVSLSTFLAKHFPEDAPA